MIIEDSKNAWNTLLKSEFPSNNDIFFRYEYFMLYSKYYQGKPELLYWQDDNVKILWTHLIRNIDHLKIENQENLKDLTTPYGYGGPLLEIKTQEKEDVKNSLNKFFYEYFSYCNQENYISEFIRFHPIFRNWFFFESLGKIRIQYLNDVVGIDLTKPLNEIHKNMKKNKRYQIRKSEERNCTVEIIDNPSNQDIDTFMKIYCETMDKNVASNKYYFKKEFIEDHFHYLNRKCILAKAVWNTQIISTSLFIFNENIVHYYLSGSVNIKGIYPADLILWNIIKWAKQHKFKWLHLGGGRASNDSLFSFKHGFSKEIFPFYTGKIVFNLKKYESLQKLNKFYIANDKFFPAYRKGFDDSII